MRCSTTCFKLVQGLIHAAKELFGAACWSEARHPAAHADQCPTTGCGGYVGLPNSRTQCSFFDQLGLRSLVLKYHPRGNDYRCTSLINSKTISVSKK